MTKTTRIFFALAVCIGIFALWVVVQMYVARGALVGFLFCGAMYGAWKAIVHSDETSGEEQMKNDHSGTTETPQNEERKDE